MTYLIKFIKNGSWHTASIILPICINVEEYVERNFSKDFIIYEEFCKSKERLRKELLTAESKFDLLRQG